MISRIIIDGKVTEIDISKDGSDRFGFSSGTTLISENQWSNLKDAVSLRSDVEIIKESKLLVALKASVVTKAVL